MDKLTKAVLRPNLPLRYRLAIFGVVWTSILAGAKYGCDQPLEPAPMRRVEQYHGIYPQYKTYYVCNDGDDTAYFRADHYTDNVITLAPHACMWMASQERR